MRARRAFALALILAVPCAAAAQQAAVTVVPRAANRSDPVVPAGARDSGGSLVAVVEVTIDATGAVVEAQSVVGEPALMQAAVDAARRWRFQAPDAAPVTTLIGMSVAPPERPGPEALGGLAPFPAARFVSRAIRDQWGMPSMAIVPPGGTQAVSGVVVDVSINGDGVPLSAYALGHIDQLTLPALQAVLAWRFLPRTDGATRTETLAVRFMKPPRKIKNVTPRYPAAAMKNHVTGTVVVAAMIGVDGRVRDATVLKSVPGLDDAALAAVRQWEFAPALRNGIPIPQKVTMEVTFSLK
jgi:TonB family protein